MTQFRFEDAVRITAADFNGKSFDGNPIVPLKGNQTPQWFLDAIEKKKIKIDARGSTDYAWFGVVDEYYNDHWAGPGDRIVRLSYQIPGVDHRLYRIVMVPGEFFELFYSDAIVSVARVFAGNDG